MSTPTTVPPAVASAFTAAFSPLRTIEALVPRVDAATVTALADLLAALGAGTAAMVWLDAHDELNPLPEEMP